MKTRSDFLREMYGTGLIVGLSLGAVLLVPMITTVNADECHMPFFSDTASEKCSKILNATEPVMFNLYSSTKPRNRESAPVGIRLNSSNEVLSLNGPQAPAELSVQCPITSNAKITLTFPGYPMFVQNKEIDARVLAGNQHILDFSAVQGDDLFQMRIVSKKVLKQFAKLLFQSGDQQFTVISVDQDGLEVRADFDPPGDVLGDASHYCLGKV